MEENQVKFQGVKGGDGDILSPSPHGENTRNIPATDQGGKQDQRGDGDIKGVFSAGTEVRGMPGSQMPVKGNQTRETQRTLHSSALEVKGGNYKGGTGTAT